jgi:hypothetical protein
MDKHAAREQEMKKDRTKISKQKTTPQKCTMHNGAHYKEKSSKLRPKRITSNMKQVVQGD